MEVATTRSLPVVEARPRFDGRLWVLVVGRFITSAGHSISFPFFAIFVHLTLGVPMTIVGAIIFTGGLVGAFAKFVGGTLSDRIGRKTVMAAALLGRALATGALGWIALAPHPAWQAIAALYIAGTMTAFLFDSACQAMVADLNDPRTRIFGYSLMRVGGNLGWATGAIVGGLIGAFGYAAMFFTTSIVTGAAFALLAIFITETLKRPGPREDGPPVPMLDCFRVPGFTVLCLGALLISAVMSQLIAPLSVFAKGHLGLPTRDTALLFTINGIIIVLFQFPVARVISRMRLTTALVGGCLLYALGFVLVGWSLGFWSVALCVLVVSTGELFVAPSTISLSANLAPPNRRGRYLGVYGFFEILGRCSGPLLGGAMLDAFATRPGVPWAVVGAIALGAALCYGTLRRRMAVDADRAHATVA